MASGVYEEAWDSFQREVINDGYTEPPAHLYTPADILDMMVAHLLVAKKEVKKAQVKLRKELEREAKKYDL